MNYKKELLEKELEALKKQREEDEDIIRLKKEIRNEKYLKLQKNPFGKVLTRIGNSLRNLNKQPQKPKEQTTFNNQTHIQPKSKPDIKPDINRSNKELRRIFGWQD